MGLGHRVAGEHLAVEQRLQVALLLLRGAVVGDDFRVARVRRLAPEHDRCPLRAAEDLVEQRELQLAVALAAELGEPLGVLDEHLQRDPRFEARLRLAR
jgi:hypothetical protein